VIQAAERLGYASQDAKGRGRLRNQGEMLADWSAFYSWRRNESRSYFWLGRGNADPADALRRELKGVDGYALSLHAGNNRIELYASYNPWHLYVIDERLERRLRESLKLEPVPEGSGNVVLMSPYYRHSALFGARVVNGLRVVSDLQLYLDLRRFPIRGIEAAERIFERRLRPLWEKAR
jgi:hypothetical protein